MLKDIPFDSQPRERFDKVGVKNLSDVELLAIILGNGTKELSVVNLASEILKKMDHLQEFVDYSIKELESVRGIGHIKAMKLIASLEFSKRVLLRKKEKKSIKYAKDVFDIMYPELINLHQEHFYLLLLDAKCHIIRKILLFIGTETCALTHPREVFKEAVKGSAVGIILVHNHPSGDVTPSNGDILFTKKVGRLGEEMGIDLYDHIVIGEGTYYSMKEKKDL